MPLGPAPQTTSEVLIGELIDMPAVVTDCEGSDTVLTTDRMGARHVGVHGFQAVHKPSLEQAIQGPINLRRSAKALPTQLIE